MTNIRISRAVSLAPVVVNPGQAYTLPTGHVIPAGFRNPLNTGWRGSPTWGGIGKGLAEMTVHSGDFTTTSHGQVVDGYDISGAVYVAHKSVTFRNCRIGTAWSSGNGVVNHSGSWTPANASEGLTVEHCEIGWPSSSSVGDIEGIRVFKSYVTVHRCDIWGMADAVTLSGNGTLTDSCVHDLNNISGDHADCVQVTNGNDVVVRGNTLIAFNRDVSSGYTLDNNVQKIVFGSPSNAAIMIGSIPTGGSVNNLLIENNYLSGGNYTINHNNAGGGGSASGSYLNNTFSGYFRYGPIASTPASMTFNSTNKWEATRDTYAFSTAGAPKTIWHCAANSQVSGTNTTPV